MAGVFVWNRPLGDHAGDQAVHQHGEVGADTVIIIKDLVGTGQDHQGMYMYQ